MLNIAAAFAEPVDGNDESKRPAAERVDDNQPKSTPALTGPVSDTDEDMPELVVELGLPAQNDSKPEKQPAKKTAAKKPAKQSVTAPTSKELAQAERRARLAREALSFRGTPYVWGGEGRGGFDCSGFTQYLYKKRGINLPHSAKLQFSKGKPVAPRASLWKATWYFSIRQARLRMWECISATASLYMQPTNGEALL